MGREVGWIWTDPDQRRGTTRVVPLRASYARLASSFA
jgi:hypothetical protein